ncbi:MAG: hypothetical protein QG667_1873, partial [Pseudomonadota bacterium]|nr:hypothetical protein [Pseudomonadota bacterium]
MFAESVDETNGFGIGIKTLDVPLSNSFLPATPELGSQQVGVVFHEELAHHRRP